MSKKKKIFFSIIIPNYNCKFINRSIDSVLNQTYKNWELIIVDNNSNKYFKNVNNFYKDKRIRFFSIQNKGVIAKSRNLGVKKAKFDWIAFLDSDDYWSKDKLLKIKNEINKKKMDLYFHNMLIHNHNKKYIKRKLYKENMKLKKPIFDSLIINGNLIPQSSVVVKKKLIVKVNYLNESSSFVTWEDFDLWLKISRLTEKFFFVDDNLGYYWVDNKKINKLRNFMKIIRNFEKYYKKDIFNIKVKYNFQEIAWINKTKAIYYSKIRKNKMSEKYLRKLKNNKLLLDINYLKLKLYLKLKSLV